MQNRIFKLYAYRIFPQFQMRSPKNPKMATVDEQQPKTIKASHSSSSSSKSIPSEIIFEILSRLPVESLLRCKSVCKSWRSLISDPYFIKYHLASSTTNHLLVCNPSTAENFKTCPVYDVLYDPTSINSSELHFPMKQPRYRLSIVGSCNGLICVSIDFEHLYIWNPSTRKSIQLPDRPRSDGGVFHGFGCNESSDDYKVVEITCSSDKYDNIVMIYSSRNGNWKEIGGFPYFCWTQDSDVFLKGALHWIAGEDSDSWTIVSLDLAMETYGEVLLPVDEVDVDQKLGILGDYLCVLCDYGRHSRFCGDVWVMKVYGVKDSWFKLLSIPYDVVDFVEQYYWGYHFSAPLFISDDGKVLLQFEYNLIVFDSENGSALEIPVFDGWCKSCTFVESLVSPSGHENSI